MVFPHCMWLSQCNVIKPWFVFVICTPPIAHVFCGVEAWSGIPKSLVWWGSCTFHGKQFLLVAGRRQPFLQQWYFSYQQVSKTPECLVLKHHKKSPSDLDILWYIHISSHRMGFLDHLGLVYLGPSEPLAFTPSLALPARDDFALSWQWCDEWMSWWIVHGWYMLVRHRLHWTGWHMIKVFLVRQKFMFPILESTFLDQYTGILMTHEDPRSKKPHRASWKSWSRLQHDTKIVAFMIGYPQSWWVDHHVRIDIAITAESGEVPVVLEKRLTMVLDLTFLVCVLV